MKTIGARLSRFHDSVETDQSAWLTQVGAGVQLLPSEGAIPTLWV